MGILFFSSGNKASIKTNFLVLSKESIILYVEIQGCISICEKVKK